MGGLFIRSGRIAAVSVGIMGNTLVGFLCQLHAEFLEDLYKNYQQGGGQQDGLFSNR